MSTLDGLKAPDSYTRRPRRPVKQKWWLRPQPTWLPTHSMVRAARHRIKNPQKPWVPKERACSTICAADSCARRPRRPVKQNWQFMPQPTWLLTHSVVRGRAPPPRTIGMSTASTAAPAPSPSCRNSNIGMHAQQHMGTQREAAVRKCIAAWVCIATTAAPSCNPFVITVHALQNRTTRQDAAVRDAEVR